MDNVDHRRHPRGIVAVAAVISPQRAGPVAGVIDLSEGGACLEWTLPADVPAGTPVRLCFLLGNDQTLEIDGVLSRVFGGRAGVEFLPAQRHLVMQLLAEVKSED
ncbi:MAG: PilZ domain-containing protein [Arenimonas sp.]